MHETDREKQMDGVELDRTAGNGSGDYADDQIDDMDTASPDKASSARTTFSGGDTHSILREDGSRVSYERLWTIHHDKTTTSIDHIHREVERKDDRKKLTTTITSQLELTNHQTNQAVTWVEDVDTTKLGALTIESIILAAVTLSANLDDRWVQREQEYRDIRDGLGLSATDVQTSRKKLKDLLDI